MSFNQGGHMTGTTLVVVSAVTSINTKLLIVSSYPYS